MGDNVDYALAARCWSEWLVTGRKTNKRKRKENSL